MLHARTPSNIEKNSQHKRGGLILHCLIRFKKFEFTHSSFAANLVLFANSFMSSVLLRYLRKCIREGFHGWDLMVVVGFSGSLAVF